MPTTNGGTVDTFERTSLGAVGLGRIVEPVDPASFERIECNPGVMLGKPVIKGTRITVELIVRKLAEGADEAYLLDEYPHLAREDILAALQYAAEVLAQLKPSR